MSDSQKIQTHRELVEPSADRSRESVSLRSVPLLKLLLEASSQSEGKVASVYSLLKANLDEVDERLGQTLLVWAGATLSGLEEEEHKQNFAAEIGNFSNLIQGFPYKKSACIEIAIAGYQIALTVYTHSHFPVEWAMTLNNLGDAYSDRIVGERMENIDAAIACYRRALTVYTREHFPVEWAMTLKNLGDAYSDQLAGERTENLDAAIACYRDALRTFLDKYLDINKRN